MPSDVTVGRYVKAGRIRRYTLKVSSADTLELWVVSEARRTAARARRLLTLTCEEELQPVLTDLERELRAGGWSAVVE